MKKSPVLIYAISIFSVVLWGLSYIWSNKLLTQGIPVEYFIFVRTMIAAGILMVFNLATGVDIKIHRKDLHKFLILALCEPFVYFICETYGLLLTESPAYSATIIATTPLFSIIAGKVFFNEELSKTNIIGFFVCFLGIVLVTLSLGAVGKFFIIGMVLLFIAAIAEVGQASATKWLAGDYKPQVITMYQFLLGAIYLSPLFFTRGLMHFNPEVYLGWSVWCPILCLAVLCTCICFTLWVHSIKELGVAKACILQALIPVVTALAGVILGSEKFTGVRWLGIAIASVGVILSQLYNAGKANPPKK